MLIKSKKSLGQNFLIDKNIIKKIVDVGNIKHNDTVLESWSRNWQPNRKHIRKKT